MSKDPAETTTSAVPSNVKKDPAWKYAYQGNPNDRDSVTCNFCLQTKKGGISRIKQHLVGGHRNSTACKKCPDHVKEEIRQYMKKKKEEKDQKNILADVDDFHFQDNEDIEEIDRKGKRPKFQTSTENSSVKSSRTIGPMDTYFMGDPEEIVRARKGKQKTMIEAYKNDEHKKEMRERACTQIARWMYDAGIAFNAVKYESFHSMIEAIGQFGPGMKPPSYHEVRVRLLNKELGHTKTMMEEHEQEWVKNGCTIMSDGWTDKRQRTSINFLVNCRKGTMFVDSIDASSFCKNGDKMYESLSKFVERIGPENVVQVVTDSASPNVVAGRMLEAKYPNLYWTPCAAHCLDLILEDIGKLDINMRTLRRATSLSSFIYTRPGVLNMMRQFTGKKELLRPAKTRFATAFLTMASIHKQKENLRKMFTSEEWSTSKWAKEVLGKKVSKIVLMPSFWTSILYCLKVANPLVRVLRLVDGEKKAPMGYIYEAMDRAKEAIMKAFSMNEEKYKEVFTIIDRRWEVQLHRPLHAAGYFLNPEFYYSNPNIQVDFEVQDGLIKSIQRLVPSLETQEKFMDELTMYKEAEGLFANSLAIRLRNKKAPAEWWSSFGSSTPNLQKFALKVLNLTCSASGCERNWSIFEHLHSKKRNKLTQQKLNDLVYIKYNRALKRRYNIRDTIDPITLNDIDDSNEWLTGRVEEDEDADNDIIFNDESGDGLTWGAYATAAGVLEPEYRFRSKSNLAAPTSFKSHAPKHARVVDDVDEVEEEDSEAYKSHDGSTDDEAFIDDDSDV